MQHKDFSLNLKFMIDSMDQNIFESFENGSKLNLDM